MGDDNNTKPNIDRAKAIEAGKQAVKPAESPEDLARKQLDFTQRMEKSALDSKKQKAKAAIESQVADKRSDLLANVSPDKKEEAKAALDQAADKAKQKVETAQSPENPQFTSTTDSLAATAAEIPAADAPTAGEAVNEPNKGIWDQIKSFFGKLMESLGLGKIFGLDKKPDPSKDSSKSDNPTNSPTNPENPPTQSLDSTDSEKLANGPDSTTGLKGKALLDNPQFQSRTEQIARKIGVSRSDLYAIFNMESGGDPTIQNRFTKATGLIQWMPNTAPVFGTTVDQLKKMTGLQQLDYVEKFYKPYFGKLHSFADLYRAVFFPASIGKGPDYIFKTANASAEKVAAQNSGIDRDTNGYISNASFDRYVAKHRPSDSAVPLTNNDSRRA